MVPSSPWLERRIIEAADPGQARIVVELGPGTGGTTRALLEAMRADGRLLSLEVNEHFIATLQGIPDQRLIPCCASATELDDQLRSHSLGNADLIVSGIPFSRLDRRLGAAIVDAVDRCLVPGGVFVAYQLSRRIEELAQPVFGAPEVRLEWRSIPPIRVFRWRKASA